MPELFYISPMLLVKTHFCSCDDWSTSGSKRIAGLRGSLQVLWTGQRTDRLQPRHKTRRKPCLTGFALVWLGWVSMTQEDLYHEVRLPEQLTLGRMWLNRADMFTHRFKRRCFSNYLWSLRSNIFDKMHIFQVCCFSPVCFDPLKTQSFPVFTQVAIKCLEKIKIE